jgi:hypothetical protein
VSARAGSCPQGRFFNHSANALRFMKETARTKTAGKAGASRLSAPRGCTKRMSLLIPDENGQARVFVGLDRNMHESVHTTLITAVKPII